MLGTLCCVLGQETLKCLSPPKSINEGVENGASKAMGLTVSFCSSYGFLQSRFFHKAVFESRFFIRLRKSQSPNLFVCFYN